MKRIFTCLFTLIGLIFNGIYAQNTTIHNSLYSETALLKQIESLSSDAFEGRRTGTKDAKKTRSYIVNQFDSLIVLSLGKNYEQHFALLKS